MALELGRNVLLDYLSFTIPFSNDGIDRVVKALNLGALEPVHFGGMGYTNSAYFLDGGRVFWHDERHEMGIHFRLNPSSIGLTGFNALGTINRVLDLGARVTRIDIAFDDLEGQLDINHIHEKLLAGNVRTRFRKVARVQGAEVGKNANIGDTINIGVRTSHAFVRIYDKKREQEAKGNDTVNIDNWVRVELELKAEKSHMFAGLLAGLATDKDRTAPAQLAANLLWGLLDFKVYNPDDENKSRWETSGWWSDFIQATSKLALSVPMPEKTMEKARSWVRNQVGPTLAMIVLSMPDDNHVSGYDFIMDSIKIGEGRLKDGQQRRLDLYNDQQRAKIGQLGFGLT